MGSPPLAGREPPGTVAALGAVSPPVAEEPGNPPADAAVLSGAGPAAGSRPGAEAGVGGGGLYLDEIGACGAAVARISPWILRSAPCAAAGEVSVGRGCLLGFFLGGTWPCWQPAPLLHDPRFGCLASGRGWLQQRCPAEPPRQGDVPRGRSPLSKPTGEAVLTAPAQQGGSTAV